MTYEFFRFELRQQLTSPLLWVMAGILGMIAFGAASSDGIQVGAAIGNVNRNAPTVIAFMFGIFTIIGMMVVVSFVANALLRDFEQGTADLYFATPMRKSQFLIGRLSAAFFACLAVFVVIAVGLLIAPTMPWIDAARLGAFSLQPYVWAFTWIVIPNVLFITALLAVLAVSTRSLMVTYLGVIGFFVAWQVSRVLMRELDNVWIATLTDPFGMSAFNRMIRYWSAAERNGGLPEIAGYFAANRALWSAIALALFGAVFVLFKPERTGTGKSLWRKTSAKPMPASAASPITEPPQRQIRTPGPNRASVVSQLLHQLRFDAKGVLLSVPFLIMLAFGAMNLIAGATLAQTRFGTKIFPVTAEMLDAIRGSFSWMLIVIATFFAGELVWKERGAKLGEVTDALPLPNWLPLAAKMAVMIAVMLVFQAFGAFTAMAVQLAKGYTVLELGLYASALLLDALPLIFVAGLALVIQVYANNKFIGYALIIGVFVVQGLFGFWHFDHNLYRFGGLPQNPYSDMNGYGHFLIALWWFAAYWSLGLLLLLALAAAFWVRGVVGSGAERLRLARSRLLGPSGVLAGAAALAMAACGAWIFYNTNVRNEYWPGDTRMDEQARYEKEYQQFLTLPQPKILAVSADVDLHPETRAVHIRGEYRIRNPHEVAIDELHVAIASDEVDLRDLDVGGATLKKFDDPFNYRIYTLTTPMAPGEERVMRFSLDVTPQGFRNGGDPTAIVENGSFFNSLLFPGFGYNPRFELEEKSERKRRGLPEPRRMPKLEDESARASTYITDDADWIEFKTTICTAPDQIALAPGYLQREFERDGRRCFSYAMDRPMLNFFAYLSARYAVKKDEHDGVAIEVYYDPKHAWNVDRMIEGVKKSLDYFNANFTPYQHKQVRILEFPGYQSFAQSFANTIPYSESIGFIADLRDPDAIDYVFYVTAHEVAHQWWAHQVIGANLQGSTLLSESLSQYSALMVMEKEYGRDKMRRFLKYELDNYLSGRGGELIEELPLYRVENQPYVHYRKGSLVFYRLREELGEDVLNRVLKRFLTDFGYQQPPYVTSKQLIEYLRAEAKPEQQDLITDLFEKISFYDNRVEEATAKMLENGKYEVTLKLHADKRYADGTGTETPGALNDWIDVGVFAHSESGKEGDDKVLYLQRHHITEAAPVITVTVDGKPDAAGFDPYNKLIDRVSADNRKTVSVE